MTPGIAGDDSRVTNACALDGTPSRGPSGGLDSSRPAPGRDDNEARRSAGRRPASPRTPHEDRPLRPAGERESPATVVVPAPTGRRCRGRSRPAGGAEHEDVSKKASMRRRGRLSVSGTGWQDPVDPRGECALGRGRYDAAGTGTGPGGDLEAGGGRPPASGQPAVVRPGVPREVGAVPEQSAVGDHDGCGPAHRGRVEAAAAGDLFSSYISVSAECGRRTGSSTRRAGAVRSWSVVASGDHDHRVRGDASRRPEETMHLRG